MPRILNRVVGLVVAVGATMVAVVAGQSTPPPRAPENGHYARLAALDATPTQARTNLDPLTFSLDRWGDLYNWKLIKPHYVTVPLDAFTAVKPPANSSAQTRAELDYLLDLQKDRTEQEHAWCVKLADIYHHPLFSNPADPRYRPNRDNLFFVGRDLGPWFRQDNLPKTTELLARVYRDAMIYIVELKLRYARPRPHHLEPRIKADDKTIPHASFPSGHSFASYINAGVLSRLAPAKRSDLLAKAHELAWSRELLGVHYPSDTAAGRVLAEDFVRFLFESADFVREFEAVQREWQERSVTNR